MGSALQSPFTSEDELYLSGRFQLNEPTIYHMLLITHQETQLGVIFIALNSSTTARNAAQTVQSKAAHQSTSPIRLS